MKRRMSRIQRLYPTSSFLRFGPQKLTDRSLSGGFGYERCFLIIDEKQLAEHLHTRELAQLWNRVHARHLTATNRGVKRKGR
jgi:hypothetical protein